MPDPAKPKHSYSNVGFDPAMGRVVRSQMPILFKTPAQAALALACSRYAAFVLAATHLATALLHLTGFWRPPMTAFGANPLVLAAINAGFGAFAFLLALWFKRKPQLWISDVLLVWSMSLVVVGPGARLYGFAQLPIVSVLMALSGLLALVGLLGFLQQRYGRTPSA